MSRCAEGASEGPKCSESESFHCTLFKGYFPYPTQNPHSPLPSSVPHILHNPSYSTGCYINRSKSFQPLTKALGAVRKRVLHNFLPHARVSHLIELCNGVGIAVYKATLCPVSLHNIGPHEVLWYFAMDIQTQGSQISANA